jgi:PIN domain nuclease of toxin-antitoxin system
MLRWRSSLLTNRGMDLLLDTCAFIWWDSGGASLGKAAAAAMAAPANRLYLSHASIWELQLKHQKGRLQLRTGLSQIIDEQCRQNGLLLLPIEPADIYGLTHLPFYHTDPYDRLIISQARIRGFSIITNDTEFPKYPIPLLW